MSSDSVEQQLELIERRLSSLNEMLGRYACMPSGLDAAPSLHDAECIADAVSNLLLSVQSEVARSHGFGPAGQGDDLVRRISELEETLLEIFNRSDAARPQ